MTFPTIEFHSVSSSCSFRLIQSSPEFICFRVWDARIPQASMQTGLQPLGSWHRVHETRSFRVAREGRWTWEVGLPA